MSLDQQKPQPKWAAFKVLNFVVMGIFLGSIGHVFMNYRQLMAQATTNPLNSIFFPIMIIWGMCLVYFFGFFGISFLDTEEISSSPSTFGFDHLKKEAEAAAAATAASTAAISATSEKEKSLNKLKKEPLNDTLICAEKSSVVCQKVPMSNFEGVNIDKINFKELTDDEIFEYLLNGSLKDYQLEKKLGDYERAVHLRRLLYENILNKKMENIPFQQYDYNKVFGANCEIVIGYVPIPLGLVGPLNINGVNYFVPMATTEGCLVASTNRGCKAITAAGGCSGIVLKDAITRAPCIKMPSAMRAAALKQWIDVNENYIKLETAFNSTTNYGRLEGIECTVAGRNLYLRFSCMAGDAMGMNMVSKGCLKAIEILKSEFPDLVLVAISGNMCTDKKPSAINWILGRGKSIVVETVIPADIISSVLKSSVHDMIEVNKQKNHIGSAMAGSIGGFNAHAANVVTAVFLATGQDPAQNVESSNCITILELADDGSSLHMSVTMPSIEVGTVGGGTHLPAQAGCLDILGVRGSSTLDNSTPGDNARNLSLIVGAAVLAGELSLIAALAANHLVKSHMEHNRKPNASSASNAASMEVVDSKSAIRKMASMPELTHGKI